VINAPPQPAARERSRLAAPGENVIGVLVTDGATHEQLGGIEEAGVIHISTADLGYRYVITRGTSQPNVHARRSIT
jgi:hypothetical protein